MSTNGISTGLADDRLPGAPGRAGGSRDSGSMIVVPVGIQTIPVSNSMSARLGAAPDAAPAELWVRRVWIGRRSGRWVLHTAGIEEADPADGGAG